ncbi:MAG: DUF3313 family protein [Myxococcota bacterium]|nr:DUF3313 family protein [Myxococcota bacterium]
MHSRQVSLIAVGAALLLGAAALGCKSGPSEEPTDFVRDVEYNEERDQYPFHRIWFAEGWNDPEYRTLVVAPVNTEYVKAATWWNEATLKGHRLEEDLANFADFTQETFRKAFLKDKNHRFHVILEPQDDSIVLELAITELVPNKAELGALGLAATVVAAPLGAGIAAKETAKGKVAMEGRWVRARDREIMVEWTDREHGKFGPINLRRATWYGHAHKIVEEWAEQWVKVGNLPPDAKIKDSRTWTLLPW